MNTYCTVGECENPTNEGRTLCPMHERRKTRCRCDGPCSCLTAPKAERLSAKGRAVEAALALADADPENDAEYRQREQAFLRSARGLGQSAAHGELVRQGMAEARKNGVRLGRPLEVDPATARAMLGRLGTVTLVAKALGKTPKAVQRALAETKTTISTRSPTRRARNGKTHSASSASA